MVTGAPSVADRQFDLVPRRNRSIRSLKVLGVFVAEATTETSDAS